MDRLQGYRDALLAHGLTVEPARIAHGDWSRESGAAAMRTLLDAGARPRRASSSPRTPWPPAPCRCCARPAATCPATSRVVGFDDSGLAATLEPPLTTVRHPLDRIADEMVRLLTDVIAGRTPLSITVPTSLVVRGVLPRLSPPALSSGSPIRPCVRTDAALFAISCP